MNETACMAVESNKARFRVPCVLLVAGLATAAGCSYIPGVNRVIGEEGLVRDRQGEYLEARTLPPTRIPSGLDTYIIDDLYVIPEVSGGTTEAFLNAPRPRPLEGRSEREVVIQRMDDASWIVVDASPSQVWPRVRDYWSEQGIDLAYENPVQGVLETAWAVRTGNSLTREKFQVTIEPGFQDDSTEISLLHVSQPQALPAFDRVQWPEKSSDVEYAYETLTDLSTYLADFTDLYQAATVSFLARNIPSEGKASLVSTPDGKGLLRLEAEFDRSWAAVGRALDRAGVVIVSRDESQGLYEVSYLPGGGGKEEEEETGFFWRMITLEPLWSPLFGSEEEAPVPYSMRVRLVDTGPVVDVSVEMLAGPAEGKTEGAQAQEQALEQAQEQAQEQLQQDPEISLLRTLMNFIS